MLLLCETRKEFFYSDFFIAMQNRRAMASYLHPQTIIRECREFIMVARSGGQKEFLSISNAGASTGIEDEAPLELTPDLSIFATLVSQGPNNTDLFIVERNLPEGQEVLDLSRFDAAPLIAFTATKEMNYGTWNNG